MIPPFSLLIFALILCFEQQQKPHPMRMKINFNPKFLVPNDLLFETFIEARFHIR